MQTFITLRNAIHPQCYSGANGLIVLYQGQQSTASPYLVWPRETSAYQWQQSKGRELDIVEWSSKKWSLSGQQSTVNALQH